MAIRRKEDGRNPRIHYRSERMELFNGQWFFHTREGTLEGPFKTEFEAEETLQRYIEVIQAGLVEKDLQGVDLQKAS